MKKTFVEILCLYFFLASPIFSQDYLNIKNVIAGVNADSLLNNLSVLAGVKEINLDGQSIRITTRYRNTRGNTNSAQFIKNKLSRYKSLKVIEQQLPDSGKNIIAIQTGLENPQRQIIVCAHFDTFLAGENSPGADDNGTGTAAVLEAARVLTAYSSANTIIYAFFDREEDDLNGSEYYASLASKNKDSIIAVINLDMLGWDKNGYSDIELNKRAVGKSEQIAEEIKLLNDKCEIGTNITITTNQSTRDADNVSFWKYNFPAILLIELYGMQNPFYHKTVDVLQNINKSFFQKCTKLGVSAVARYTTLTAMDGVSSVEEVPALYFHLEQNYPNPYNPYTTIKFSIPERTPVTLEIFNVLGEKVAHLLDGEYNSGMYEVKFNAESLSSGMYLYQLRAKNTSISKKMLYLK